MRIELLICPLVMIASVGATAAPLEQRFGPDRERGYRPERGFGEARCGFENRDRSNFLGANRSLNGEQPAPRCDLHPSLPVSLQR